MDILNKNGFYSPTKGSMTIGKIISEIKKFIDDNPQKICSIIIGSDSQIHFSKNGKEYDFVTVIIIHRRGYGASYFWKKEKVNKQLVLRERIYNETMRSLTTALEIVPILRECLPKDSYNFEIHIDVGEKGKTREMINEVVGMVTGNGFVAKIKPEAYGASSVADKHT